MQKESLLPPLKHLDDKELERLIALWRNHARRGSDEAQEIIYAFESELTRRNIVASVKINDSFFQSD